MAKRSKGESLNRFTDDTVDKGTSYFQNQNAPIMGNAMTNQVKAFGGTGQVISGMANRDGAQIKKGLKNVASSALNSLTGGSLLGLNKPPDRSHYGGSAEGGAALQDRNANGMAGGTGLVAAGANKMDMGVSQLGHAAAQADQNRDVAGNQIAKGNSIGGQSMAQQDARLNASVAAASAPVASAAEQQMRTAADQNNRQMMGMAAASRGGNAASAMRTAQAAGARNSIEANQAAGQLRLQEDQARRGLIVQANQNAAGAMGARTEMGYGMADKGLSQANTATGLAAQIGSAVGQIGSAQAGAGNTMTGQYLTADTAQNNAQLEADTKYADAKKKASGGALGAVGNVIGSFFGG